MNIERDHDEPTGERTPTLVDLVVFAPIGFALKASSVVPELIATGRAEYRKQAVMARVIGKMVVEQQRRKRRGRVITERPGATVVETKPAPLTNTETPADGDASSSKASAALSMPTGSTVLPTADELPIGGYDTLAARSILTLLEGLGASDLNRIEVYERAHRQRATVLHRITQLRHGR